MEMSTPPTPTPDDPIHHHLTPLPLTSSCVSCHAESPKYKCPKCYLKYCSAGCCQSHKRNGTCSGIINQGIGSHSSTMELSSRKRAWVGEKDLDDPYQQLVQLLKSPFLRDWIRKLDESSSKDVPYLYERAMEDPLFVEYAQLIGKLREGEDGSDSSEDD